MEQINASIKNASHMKPEDLEEKIQRAEEKIEVESLSMKEERELQRQIK